MPWQRKQSTNQRQPMEWEKIFANNVTNRGLVSKICKQLIELNNKKTKDPVKKSSEKTYRWPTDT